MTLDAPTHYADRLCSLIRAKKTPLIVGLDPRCEQLPPSMLAGHGSLVPLAIQAQLYQQFCCEIIDAVHRLIPAVKPQAAFFEQLGPAGMMALANVIEHAKSVGLMVILDAKRGDIGSTAVAYAAAYLGARPLSPWGCDALTVNPYLGEDSLEPFVTAAKKNNAGIYVLAKTSNPGSRTLQEKIVDGQPVYSHIADLLQSMAQSTIGDSGYGIVGAVVGATYPEQLWALRQQMRNTLLLIPGYGAQGGTAADVAGGFDEQGQGAVINSSRGIIFAYERREYRAIKDWQVAVAQATQDSIAEIASETRAGRISDSVIQ